MDHETYIGLPVSGLVICFRVMSSTFAWSHLRPGVHSYLRGIEVLCPIGILLEQLTTTMAEQLMVSYLQLEGAGVPSVVQVDVVRMNERQFLICPCEASSLE